ncbi:MAG: hypothetical protein QOH79_3157 [Acidimicrobiaceae bacterium]
MPQEGDVYSYRDFHALLQHWSPTAAIVLADDAETLLATLSEDYLAAAVSRMSAVLDEHDVPTRALHWGSGNTKFGYAVQPTSDDRLYEPFGTVGWIVDSPTDDWFSAVANSLASGTPRLGLMATQGSRNGIFVRYEGNDLVPLDLSDTATALMAFCADALDDFGDFWSDFYASMMLRRADAGGSAYIAGMEPPERIGEPPAWGAPWRAIDANDRTAFETAMELVRQRYSPLAVDVMNIGYHRRALESVLWRDHADPSST